MLHLSVLASHAESLKTQRSPSSLTMPPRRMVSTGWKQHLASSKGKSCQERAHDGSKPAQGGKVKWAWQPKSGQRLQHGDWDTLCTCSFKLSTIVFATILAFWELPSRWQDLYAHGVQYDAAFCKKAREDATRKLWMLQCYTMKKPAKELCRALMFLHGHSSLLKPKANLKRVLHTIHLHSDSPEHRHKKN